MSFINVAPKEVRENIARANGYLRRGELDRALMAMGAALRQFAGLKLMRAAKAELDIQISEFLRDLVRNQGMQPLLDPANSGNPRKLPYQPGRENALATVLEGLAKILKEESSNSVRNQLEAKAERKKTLIQTGIQLLNQGQAAKGRAFLKRAAEEFHEEKGIHIQIGQIFAAAHEPYEAAEMFLEAIRRNPRNAPAYVGAVNAWMEANEYEKAEKVYKEVLRTFGGHPSTYGKMARLYLAWHKKNQAIEMAERALQGDSRQADAIAVMEELSNK